MRRSRSVSNIPVPSHLVSVKRDHSQNARPSSSIRDSDASGFSRRTKASLTRVSKVTPVSNRLGTPAVSSHGSSSRKRSPGSAYREKNIFHNKLNNNSWVDEQYQKVTVFVNDNDLFELPGPTLKPISLQHFIHISRTLLERIFDNVDVTRENYKEVITEKLKVLQFPGTIPMSTLKAVNIMRSWPQIISLLAFLVDKVKLEDVPDDFEDTISCNIIPEENRHVNQFLYTQDCVRQLYNNFNEGNDTNQKASIYEAHDKRFADLVNGRIDHVNAETETRTDQRKKLKCQEEEIKLLTIEEKDIKIKIETTTANIKKCTEMIEYKSIEIKEELSKLKATLEKLQTMKDELIRNKAQLEKRLENQQCTVEEKDAILKKIQALQSEIDLKNAKVEHAKKIKNECDAKLEEDRLLLRNKVVSWNMNIMEAQVQLPRLKDLQLPENKFYDTSYLDVLDEMLALKAVIEAELVEQLRTAQEHLTTIRERTAKCNVAIEQGKMDLTKTKEMIATVKETTDRLEQELQCMKNKFKEEEEELGLELFELQESADVKSLQATHNKLTNERDELIVERENTVKKATEFFVEVHKSKVRSGKMIIQVMNDIENSYREKAEEVLRRNGKWAEIVPHLEQLTNKKRINS